MRILVVGAGATGGFFGGMLARAGRDATFLLREKRARQVQESGLVLQTPTETITVRPQVVTAAELRDFGMQKSPFDLIVISTKSYGLEGAMEDIAPAVGPKTMLLPILNGMRQIAVLAERFGAARVLGGSVRIVADMDADGRIQQKTSLGEMSYGELRGERTERIAAVDAALRGAGFEAVLQPDILATLWQKWWILASIGTVCVLARGTIGQVSSAPQGQEFVRAVIAECTAIAAENGYPATPAMLASHIERLTETGSPLTSSMYRDMTKGAPVEADHVLGDLLARAGRVEAPLVRAAYVQLKVYEAGR